MANERGALRAVAYPKIKYLGFPLSVSETFQKRNTNASREEAFRRLQSHIEDIWKKAEAAGERYFPHEYMYKMLLSGVLEEYYQIDPKNSWMIAAMEKNIPIFKKERIFFESSAAAKVRKIKSLSLDFYVDDLLSILNHRQFPVVTKKILFNSAVLFGFFIVLSLLSHRIDR